ncbi:tudor domain-containing protein 1-like [Dermacentor albipictus]|uniref:tudor domain-containing protein 1-like n=1 Tax=Dermacentor albipictus TaxID=60249 RepID=UPI0031FBC44C
MSLSDRFRFDAKKKEELDDVRRRIEERYGVPSHISPPPGAGRGKGISSSPFPPEDLKSIRVDVGSRPGERRVYSSSSSSSSSSSGCSSRCSSSSSSSDDSFKTCRSFPSGDSGLAERNLQVVITGNASGEQTRTVIARDLATLPDQKCVYCGEFAEFLCHICKAYYCSPDCQLKDWPSHKDTCQKKGLLPTPRNKLPEKDKGISSPKRGGQRSNDVLEKERVSSPQKPSSQKGNAFSGGVKDRAFGKLGQDGSPRRPQDKPAPHSPNRPKASPQQAQSPAPSAVAEHPQVHTKVDKPTSTRHLEFATLRLGEDVEVVFSYGTSLSEFFLQNVSDMPDLAQLQATLQAECATSKRFKPTKGEYCAALFADDGQWYRARVTSLDSSCTVYFIDYGNVAQVPFESICQLPESCKKLPAQALRCRLYDLHPASTSAGWPEEAFSLLASLIQNGTMVATVCRFSEGFHEVELKPNKGGQSLNEQLVAKGFAERIAASAPGAISTPKATPIVAPATNTVTSRLRHPLKSILNVVKAGDILPMQVTVSAKNVVWCLTMIPEVAGALVEVEESLQQEGKEPGNKDVARGLTCGDYVASKSLEDKRWYRACVVEKTASGHTVRYLDYGNDESDTDLIPLAPAHLAVPAAAVRLLTTDPTSFRVGQLLSFSVESADADGTIRGTATSQEDGKTMGTFALAAWHSGLDTKEPIVAAALKPAGVSTPTLPRLQSLLSLVKPGESLRMQVTVSARNTVWCLAMTTNVAGSLVEIEQRLQDEGSKLGVKGVTHKVNCGDFVASRSTEDGRWYRACVTEKTATGHTVRYLDYGNDESNTDVFPLAPTLLIVPAAAVCVLASDPTSFRVGQLLNFSVKSIDGGTVRGTATSEEDGTKMGMFALAPWNCGLAAAGEPVVSPSPQKPAAGRATPPSTSPPAPPFASHQPKMDAKVLHVPQRKLPTTKCPMIPVWKTPEVLYLQQQSLASELQAMMEALNTWVRSESPQSTVAKYSKGDYVCALFSEDATWYRGQVVTERSPDGKYLVLFIDFGNSEQLPVSSLRPLPPRFAEAPLFAISVVPQNVRPADPRLAALLEQEPFAAVQVEKTRAGLPVVRLERKDGTCLNECIRGVRPKESALLVAGGQAPEEEPQKAPVDALPPPARISDCPVPKGPFDAVVSSVEGNLVYVQPIMRCQALLKITELLADKARRDPGVKFSNLPAVNECVLALYSEDEQWYRARVVSTDEAASTVRVMFVDYGNTENMTVKLLLPMKEELAMEPACAMAVQLEGVPVLKPRAHDFISKEALVVELVDNGKPPQARLMLNGKCINAVAAPKDASPETVKIPQGQLPSGRTEATVLHRIDNSIYLRTAAGSEMLKKLQPKLAAYATASDVPEKVAVGEVVCALHPKDHTWQRARIVGTAEDMFSLFFVDTGTTATQAKRHLRSLPLDRDCCLAPALAIRAQLDGVKRLSDALVSPLTEEVVFVETVESDDKPTPSPSVRIFSKSGECITDILRTLVTRRAPKKTFSERPLPDGRTKAVITHVADPGGLFYLQQSSLGPELQTMMAELNSSVPDTPLPSPALGDAVCARYAADGIWYRATVLSVPEDGKCKVSFVDFGNDDFVPVGDIRPLAEKFKSIQVIANCVALQGVKSIAKECVAQLLNIEVDLEVVDTSSQPCKAKLYAEDQCLNELIE